MNLRNEESSSGFEIAIIGMGVRFPKAANAGEFWANLRNGVEAIDFFSTEEVLEAGVSAEDSKLPSFVPAGGILGDAEYFDAAFFGFSPREAELMDPQHRIFLECAWEALEDAAYVPDTFRGSIGVYAGSGLNRYLFLNILGNRELVNSAGIFQIQIGNDKDHLATRVSYKFGLRGPSVAVQTACSTSLVAVHVACQSLIAGECDLALAGGVSILTPEKTGYFYQDEDIGSPDGHCRAFDARAAGTVRGSGAGVVVLKRLSEAIADRDRIVAVIKGSAVNNDGALKVGYTAPSVQGQAGVILAAQAIAGVDARTIGYIEAHGTGTLLGDPIEVAALAQAFRSGGDTRRQACAMGSVKSNVGHLDTAAGVCGLIKTALSLQHEEIPASLHFERPNPKIEFSNTPFYVNSRLQKWPRGEVLRRAGVSSFGIGGTNAHVVLEEAPPQSKSPSEREWNLLVFSGRSEAGVQRVMDRLAGHVRAGGDAEFADAAYTLAVGRKAHRFRNVVIARSWAEACEELERRSEVLRSRAGESAPPITFMFPGQGAQYDGMGRELYRSEPAFRKAVDRCLELLHRRVRFDPQLLINGEAELQQTEFAQPALFVLEYSLAKLWMHWGIRPASMVGHSIGEYVAACLAGVMDLGQALELVALRGRLMQDLPRGGMLAVNLGEREALQLLRPGLDLASANGRELCVIAGGEEAVAGLEEKLQGLSVHSRRLKTSHAFHSAMMDPVLPVFRRAFDKIELGRPLIPFISDVTGDWITADQARSPDYWVQHLRSTVRFGAALELLLGQAGAVLLEVGPGKTLSQLASVAARFKNSSDKDFHQTLILEGLPSSRQESNHEVSGVLRNLGRLWIAGAQIDWVAFYEGQKRNRVALPTYPFDRQRYWLEPAWGRSSSQVSGHGEEDRRKLEDWFYLPSWERSMPPSVQGGAANRGRACLLLVDRCGLAEQLGKRLVQEGWRLTWVYTGESFRKVGERHYEIRPAEQSDWRRLLNEFESSFPGKIVHLWNVSPAREIGTPERSLDYSFYSLLCLGKNLSERTGNARTDLLVVSNGVHAVDGADRLDPFKATLLGPCFTIPQEFERTRCSNVDLRWESENAAEEAWLVNQLVREIGGDMKDKIVAYRGSHRLVPAWNRVRLEDYRQTVKLRDNGVYAITGGLGGIALEIAEYLCVRAKAPYIALLARSRFPEKREWERWLRQHPEDDASETIRRLQRMERNGGTIAIFQVDVTDEREMERVREKIGQQIGKVNGIIHAAGVAGGGIIQMRTREQAARVLAAKIQGTLVVDRVFPKLDFLLLCSSVTALLGGVGQVDYCAANAFMDAFAAARRQENPASSTISVNWDAWQQTGMAVHTAIPKEWEADRASNLKDAIRPEEGKAVLERILGAGLTNVVVSTRDLNARARASERYLMQPIATDPQTPKKYPRPDSAGTFLAPANELEAALAELWQELLGVEPVGRNDNFLDFGGHSLLAIQLISRVREMFRAEVQLNAFFENGTPAGLAAVLKGLESEAGQMEQIARTANRIGHLSDTELTDALEQGSLGAARA